MDGGQASGDSEAVAHREVRSGERVGQCPGISAHGGGLWKRPRLVKLCVRRHLDGATFLRSTGQQR
jgi:hypothetical protein